MKLWHISQSANTDYDSYDSAVVAAETAVAARDTYPGDVEESEPFWRKRAWVLADQTHLVTVRLIGEAVEGTPAGVICASFNAG